MQVNKTRNFLGVRLAALYSGLSNPIAALTSKESDEYQRALNLLKATSFPCNKSFCKGMSGRLGSLALSVKVKLDCDAWFTSLYPPSSIVAAQDKHS